MSKTTLQIHPSDNVLVALEDLKSGTAISIKEQSLVTLDAIPAKHKVAIGPIDQEGAVIMYGVKVGVANKAIRAGELITTANIRHATNEYHIETPSLHWNAPDVSKWKDKTFMGFRRDDGRVGTRNYWVIVPMVFCENRNLEMMKDAMLNALGYGKEDKYKQFMEELTTSYRDGNSVDQLQAIAVADQNPSKNRKRLFPNVDGVKFLTHSLGCGGTRQDSQALCGLLAGYITHPNVAGATIMSLGCQHAQVSILQEEIKKRNPLFSKPLIVLEQQQLGSEKRIMEEALRKTFIGLIDANKFQREPAPLGELCIGLECGGSDGFSGISANPTLGKVSDKLVAMKGSVILSEFPELCGVEQELGNRCTSVDLSKRFIQLMHDYNERSKAVGSGFDMNPSPGNIKDGLITDAIKSAGAARKGGTSPVTDVLDYPEPVTKPGLALLCTPGSDVESTTAEVGSGANLVLFTTGLGTPTGNPIAPVIKVSTNTPLYKKMNDIIDIDTGTIINKQETLEEAADRMIDLIIKVASGEVLTKAELLDQDDFIPWKRGVSL